MWENGPEALWNLKEAVRLFVEEADKMGTLKEILDEAGFSRHDDTMEGPEFVSLQQDLPGSSFAGCQASLTRFLIKSSAKFLKPMVLFSARARRPHLA